MRATQQLGASRRFFPNQIAGCICWLRADRGVTMDGSNLVSAWADQSGAGLVTATQSTGARKPLFVASAFSGRAPTLRGNADAARGLVIAGLTFSGQGTQFLVFVKSAENAYYTSGASDSSGCIISGFGGTAPVQWFTGADTNNFAAAPTNAAHVASITQIDGVSCRAYLDGAPSFSITPSVAMTSVKRLMSDAGFTVGTAGDIPEFIAYSRALSDTERQHVTAYLRARYL